MCQAKGQQLCNFGIPLKKVNRSELIQSDLVAFVFLNDECPICMHYASEINRLDSLSRSLGVPVVGVFSGYYRKKDIMTFAEQYNISIPLFLDKNTSFARKLSARVTPEIVIAECVSGLVRYRGLIDDAYAGLGVKKTNTGSQYFINAVRAIASGEREYQSETKAIGCMIQLKK